MKKISRRSFVGSTAFLSLAGFFGVVSSCTNANESQNEKFVHHVFFWLKNPDAPEDKAKLIEGLNSLKKIKGIRLAHIGVPASTNRDVIESSYAISWLLFFDNLEDQNSYQEDPIHLKFVQDYSHLWSKVVVYDSVDV